MLPVNWPPIRATSVWVNRVRSGAITTMKSIPVAFRIDSVCGCSTAVGSRGAMAAAVEFIFATDSVTAMTFCRVSSSASRRASSTAARPGAQDQDQQQRQLPGEQFPRDTRPAPTPEPQHARAPPRERNELIGDLAHRQDRALHYSQ